MPSYTEEELRSWGVSGEPVRNAPESAAVAIGAIRKANLEPSNSALASAATELIADIDADLDADAILLPTAATGTFTAELGDDHVVTFTSDDEALGLGTQTWWHFGDGSSPVQGTTVEHQYAEPGVYPAAIEIAVAGVVFRSVQELTVGEPAHAVPVITSPEDGATVPPVHDVLGTGEPNTPVTLNWIREDGHEEPTAASTTVGDDGTFGFTGDTEASPDTIGYRVIGDQGQASEAVYVTVDFGDEVPEKSPRLGFEPDAYTVAEVQDYVNSVAEGDRVREAEAVLDLERNGKNRSTLVGWLEAVIAGETD